MNGGLFLVSIFITTIVSATVSVFFTIRFYHTKAARLFEDDVQTVNTSYRDFLRNLKDQEELWHIHNQIEEHRQKQAGDQEWLLTQTQYAEKLKSFIRQAEQIGREIESLRRKFEIAIGKKQICGKD